jgi:hypothetical protein
METNGHPSSGLLKTVEAAGDVEVERALVGALSGRDVNVKQAAVGAVMASGDVRFDRGGSGPLMAGGNVEFHQAGCGPVLTTGNVTFEQGGCQTVIAGGGVTVGGRGFVGLALTPRVDVQEGGRVLIALPQAAAFGAALGVVAGLVLRSRRKKD